MQKENKADYILDRLNFNLTIQFEDIIKQKSKILIKFCELKDIYKQDNCYYASVSAWYPSYYFKLKITQEHKEHLLTQNDNDPYYNTIDSYLIVQLDSIKKIDLSVVSYGDNNLEVNASNSFTAKGELIDLIIKQQ